MYRFHNWVRNGSATDCVLIPQGNGMEGKRKGRGREIGHLALFTYDPAAPQCEAQP